MNAALLLVDLQGDFLERDDLDPPRDELLAAARMLVDLCREHGVPVLHTHVKTAN